MVVCLIIPSGNVKDVADADADDASDDDDENTDCVVILGCRGNKSSLCCRPEINVDDGYVCVCVCCDNNAMDFVNVSANASTKDVCSEDDNDSTTITPMNAIIVLAGVALVFVFVL